jgi:hypothetical protein
MSDVPACAAKLSDKLSVYKSLVSQDAAVLAEQCASHCSIPRPHNLGDYAGASAGERE